MTPMVTHCQRESGWKKRAEVRWCLSVVQEKRVEGGEKGRERRGGGVGEKGREEVGREKGKRKILRMRERSSLSRK